MPASTANAINNGLNLAYWLYRVQPALFKALQAPATQYRAGRKLSRFGQLRGLGDDATVTSTDVGTTTTFDSSGISSDLIALPDPVLTDVGVSVPDVSSDVGAAIGAANAPTFDVSGPVAQTASGISGALSSVGSFLASTTGLTSLTNLATAVYRANTPQASTIATQIARVQSGVTPAPITYGYNSQGQLVPVLAQGGITTPLSRSTLSSLIPAGLSQYALPIGLGVLFLWAIASRK